MTYPTDFQTEIKRFWKPEINIFSEMVFDFKNRLIRNHAYLWSQRLGYCNDFIIIVVMRAQLTLNKAQQSGRFNSLSPLSASLAPEQRIIVIFTFASVVFAE